MPTPATKKPSVELIPIDPRLPDKRQRILALWNAAIGLDFPLDDCLLEQNLRLEENSLFCLLARAGGRDAGVILAKQNDKILGQRGPSPGQGCISFLMVQPEHQRKGIGSRLLGEAETWLASRGVKHLHWGRDTWHFFPGAPEPAPALAAFLAARAFTPATSVVHDLHADLGTIDLIALGQGLRSDPQYSVHQLSPELHPDLAAFFARCFPGRWEQDSADALAADPPMRDADILVLTDDGQPAGQRVIGFARVYDRQSTVLGPGVYWRVLMGAQPGGLGPIGVDAAYRGRGLGLLLLHRGLAALAGRGVRQCVIDWTDLVEFYGKMGFSPWKTYRNHAKEL